MPLYESRTNAENRIKVSPEAKQALVFGTDAVIEEIVRQIQSKKMPCRVAVDGWYGVDYGMLISRLSEALGLQQKNTICTTSRLFLPKDQIAAYKQPFITDDPGFGYVNSEGRIEDVMDQGAIAALHDQLLTESGIAIIAGPGAYANGLEDAYDLVFYAEKTRQPLLWQMWDGQLAPLGSDVPDADYQWKEYYYCDYYLLHHQKEKCIEAMHGYIEANDMQSLKLVPHAAYDEILSTLLRYPIKEIKIYQPGPWGAYRYKDLFDVPGLACNAWNELAGPELGMLIDVGREDMLCIPFVSLMRYADEFVGAYLNRTYPGLFPLDVWLDDGYFDKPTPAERISMPIHNHPSTDYVKRHFNEPLGRYETYYIAEAYEGANTWMGYQDDADMEEWERKCRASENIREIPDWKDYISNWESNVGDLYLIPPGTAHGHGGNQMVLEMDTCPSIAGTEYSFFTYDFARNSWDDGTKTMTGKPCKMHLEHSFDNDKFRRGNWVKDHLLAKPKVEKWTKQYQKDIYSTLSEMPFEIERFHFTERAENDTQGRFMNILTLTVGKSVRVVSRANPEYQTQIELFQSCVIPASFGKYEIINEDGGFSTVVQIRWKKG
ncbi:hypothetical protein LJC33_04825 [Eubacteriales bacterium OttesenSCG-928-N13]|nr:hypothetical protein [Eubacteriales bacterium OttesenSCG-928-N13]